MTTLVSTFLPFFLNTATLYLLIANPPASAGAFHFAPAVSLPPFLPLTGLTLRGFDSLSIDTAALAPALAPTMLTAATLNV